MFTEKERENLIVSHMPFAEKIAFGQHRRLPSTVHLEDVKSAAYCGLVDAASRYNGGVPFEVFASFRINGEIKDYLRSLEWGTRNNPWRACSWDESHDYASEAEPEINTEVDAEMFDYLTDRLNPVEKKVVRMYFLDGMLLKDIGDKLSRSESWACGVLKSALKNFKELWQDSELELRQLVSR